MTLAIDMTNIILAWYDISCFQNCLIPTEIYSQPSKKSTLGISLVDYDVSPLYVAESTELYTTSFNQIVTSYKTSKNSL